VSITVNIKPEVQAELARRAACHGSPVEAYAANLLEEAVQLPSEDLANTERRKREERGSLVEVCAMVRGLTDDIDFSRNPSTGRPIDLS
jgi:plasmid stability protein